MDGAPRPSGTGPQDLSPHSTLKDWDLQPVRNSPKIGHICLN
ncbi:hypothetical protein Nmel_017657 [Mimus melanotis]